MKMRHVWWWVMREIRVLIIHDEHFVHNDKILVYKIMKYFFKKNWIINERLNFLQERHVFLNRIKSKKKKKGF